MVTQHHSVHDARLVHCTVCHQTIWLCGIFLRCEAQPAGRLFQPASLWGPIGEWKPIFPCLPNVVVQPQK